MKKIAFNYKKWTFWGIGAVLTVAPLALAASCGSSESSSQPPKPIQETYRDKFLTNISKFKFDLTSTDGNVKSIAPTLDPIAKSYKYLVGNYATIADAKAAPATAWVSTLPTTVDYVHANRYLYLQVETKTEAELVNLKDIAASDLTLFSGDNQYFDLTASSSIQDIKSNVDNTDAFKAITNLDRVVIGGTLDTPTISVISGTAQAPIISDISTIAMPVGTTLKFNINNQWLSATDLVDYIKINKATVTQSTLNAVKVKIFLTDVNKYLLTDAKENAVTSRLIFPGTATFEDLTAELQKITADTTSVHSQVVWNNTGSINAVKPQSVASIQYYAGPEATLDLVKVAPAITWVNDLPTAVSETHASRHLYVKLSPAIGFTLAETYLDLTSSSNIQKIITIITTSATDLSSLELTGSRGSPVISNINSITLEPRLKLEFKISKSDWLSQSAFVTYITTNIDALTASDYHETMRVRLAANDDKLFSLDNSREASLKNNLPIESYFLIYNFGGYSGAKLYEALKALRINKSSTTTAIIWDNVEAVTNESKSLEVYYYLGSDYDRPDNGFIPYSKTLPTTVTGDKSTRKFFVKVVSDGWYKRGASEADITQYINMQDL